MSVSLLARLLPDRLVRLLARRACARTLAKWERDGKLTP